jgi:hypothetical protein
MNIIKYLQKNINYEQHSLQVLVTNINVLDVDCSKGETDCIKILFVEKGTNSFEAAIAILIMKQKMLSEEWNNIANYTEKDIQFWITLLEKEYAYSTYNKNIIEKDFTNDFFIKRLEIQQEIQSLNFNDTEISFETFQKINPINNKFIQISKSDFKRLAIEYYVETDLHFVLFHWYTTA